SISSSVPNRDLHSFPTRRSSDLTFDLPIVEVVEGGNIEEGPYVEDGKHINSDFINGMYQEEAIETMINWLEENGKGERKVTYRLRDWLFYRQRYCGETISNFL